MGASNLWNVKETRHGRAVPQVPVQGPRPARQLGRRVEEGGALPALPVGHRPARQEFSRPQEVGRTVGFDKSRPEQPGRLVLGERLRPRSDHRRGVDARPQLPRHVRGLGHAQERRQAVSQPQAGVGRLHRRQAGVAAVAGRRGAHGRRFPQEPPFPDGCFPCSWSIDLHAPDPTYSKGQKGEEFISRATVGRRAIPTRDPTGRPIAASTAATFRTSSWPAATSASRTRPSAPVRVMRTCGMMGEVVGMAAALCKQFDCTPRDIYSKHLEALKKLLTRGAGRKPPMA